MLHTQTLERTAPAVAARVLEFGNNGSLAPYCVVENLDAGNSLAIKYQESDDGSTWTDIAGTTDAVNPGASGGKLVVSVRRRIALHAGGNVKFQFSLVRTVNGSPADLGAA